MIITHCSVKNTLILYNYSFNSKAVHLCQLSSVLSTHASVSFKKKKEASAQVTEAHTHPFLSLTFLF